MNDPLMRLTHALRNPETAVAAAHALRGRPETAAVEALVETLYRRPSAQLALAVVSALVEAPGPLADAGLRFALATPHEPVRLQAAQALRRRGDAGAAEPLAQLLVRDPSWPGRRAALQALAALPEPAWSRILAAADDPHWRVRHALLMALLPRGDTPERRADLDARLAGVGDGARVRGLRAYLRWRWTGEQAPAAEVPEPEDPRRACPFWDGDPTVLARTLAEMDEAAVRGHLDTLAFLVGHPDERVARQAVDGLRRWGEPAHLARAVAWLADPRTGAGAAVRRLLGYLDLDRTDALTRLLAAPIPPPEPPPPPPADPQHPVARAAVLTPERAAALVRDPTQETSWLVLERAARLTRTPFWELEPDPPWQPPAMAAAPPEPLAVRPQAPAAPRLLGPERLAVAPLGISGHYGLPVEGFARAAEAGVNLLFWEPNYQTLTDFAARLAPADRRRLHFVAGTFEADPRRVRQDAERALRALRIERLAVFLTFWVQSWDRITPAVRAALEDLRAAGKVACFGLSTHSRPLAAEALADGWDPVMVRHSAAHRGAEERLFPTAALGRGLLAFNATNYGRLLKDHGHGTPPTAADCYRYTIARPGVAACWSAPATLAQLAENLEVLRDPRLPPEREQALLTHGAAVYREDRWFRRCVRDL